MPHSFFYIADERTRALVIGSMPGEASLAAGEYYAHRHNLFWRFVFEAYGEPFDPKAPPAYGIKTGLLLAHGVGLWDAAESCAREGSLDSDIRDAMPNDFAALFALYPEIERLCLTGRRRLSFSAVSTRGCWRGGRGKCCRLRARRTRLSRWRSGARNGSRRCKERQRLRCRQ